MSHPVVRKDLILFMREALVKGLLTITIVLLFVSTLTGLQREQVFQQERAAAEKTDSEVWMGQGDRNPHSAAHFSRYAFRPGAPLGMLDPGTTDYAGMAIWMEAHFQDPAVFRRAEDSGESSRYAQLTPAFLFLVIAPLLVFLMLSGSIAGEYEDGTLRQLLATGVTFYQFFTGKLFAGLRLTLLPYTLVFVCLALVSLSRMPAEVDTDTFDRLAALYLTYAVYLATFVALAIGISALFRTRQSAFLALISVWVLSCIIVPRFAADLATSLYPQPDSRRASTELSAASNAYYADKERQAEIEKEVLQRYRVNSVEELPINYGAFTLQVSEDLSEHEFDRFYEQLDQLYANQESIIRWFGWLSPNLPATHLSRAAAGTDRQHQRAFAQAAEDHRRDMIQMLNEDYMYNGIDPDTPYAANAELWEQFEDFDHAIPTLGSMMSSYRAELVALVLWLFAALAISYLLVRRVVHSVGRAA